MRLKMNDFVENAVNRYPALSVCRNEIEKTIELLIEVVKNDSTIFVAGNGGSASDADHICGEFLKGFMLKRELTPDEKNALSVFKGNQYRFFNNGCYCTNLRKRF